MVQNLCGLPLERLHGSEIGDICRPHRVLCSTKKESKGILEALQFCENVQNLLSHCAPKGGQKPAAKSHK